jgi:putative serine/threonine protein kinase
LSEQKNLVSVPIHKLLLEPYINILCYPTSNINECERRIRELENLNVDSLIFEGKTKIGGIGLLGKGCVSLVVKSKVEEKIYALKIRRIDANRPSMHKEAELHRFANKLGVGAYIHKTSDNFILMDIADGLSIVSWLRNLKGSGSTAKLREVSLSLLTQCYKLDQAGFDHGELSNLEKHVYVGEKTIIIDFETSSLKRRVSNVTSAVQNIFVGGSQSKKVRRMLRLKKIDPIIKSAKNYKNDLSAISFDKMLRELNILRS